MVIFFNDSPQKVNIAVSWLIFSHQIANLLRMDFFQFSVFDNLSVHAHFIAMR